MTHRRYPVGHSERKSDKPPSNLSHHTIPGQLRDGNTAGSNVYANPTLPVVTSNKLRKSQYGAN